MSNNSKKKVNNKKKNIKLKKEVTVKKEVKVKNVVNEEENDIIIDEEDINDLVRDDSFIKKFGWVFAIIPVVALIVVSFIVSNKEEDTGMLNYTMLVDAEQQVYQIENAKYIESEEETDLVKIEVENYGIMIAELYPNIAPISVENFKKLVSEKFYDNLTFHRVIKDFMIQTGDPTATGSGGSEETIKGEFSANGVENDLSHTRGVLSMARKGSTPETEETLNSATSQFFIVHADSTYLDGNYAAFGKVIHGLDVIDDVASVSTDSNDKPTKDQVILSIRFVSEYEG